MSIVEKLTEGIVNRDMKQEGAALLNKWSSTGLLEGLNTDQEKSSMARLLENQAKELLRESNTMEGSSVEGFAAVAFPIVRRVFAGLIANDLVSVQPMSLPSGLIFFLDFAFSPTVNPGRGGTDGSIYGGGRVGSEITGGVLLNSLQLDQQPFGFSSAYASPTGSAANAATAASSPTLSRSGVTLAGNAVVTGAKKISEIEATAASSGGGLSGFNFDPDLATEHAASYALQLTLASSTFTDFNDDDLSQIVVTELSGAANGLTTIGSSIENGEMVQVRRLTRKDENTAGNVILTFLSGGAANDTWTLHDYSWPRADKFEAGAAEGSVKGASAWALEGEAQIPEIDIKVDSVAITAMTKKLKAKWTPELGQDLNAYHNLDAEVELTSILSEQIALEIDREILSDLVNGATAATLYWSRSPGLFVNRETGNEIGATTSAPDFTGTVSEWYETLIETINDVSANIHRKTLRGGANFVVCGPELANVLEFTAGFRANVTADADKGEIGAVKVGSLNRKFDVVVDPYFPRNVVLVGRKGSSFLESGYVYAPYVPLQTTPTIFGPEDFVPRKGVMTRYAKKMVRPDMYGLVIVRGLIGESGA
jgi:hypothetical protein